MGRLQDPAEGVTKGGAEAGGGDGGVAVGNADGEGLGDAVGFAVAEAVGLGADADRVPVHPARAKTVTTPTANWIESLVIGDTTGLGGRRLRGHGIYPLIR